MEVKRSDRFDAIVVGSGFGGAVCAARLAEKGVRVLVLERGPWWGPLNRGRPAEDQREFPRGLFGIRKLLRSLRFARKGRRFEKVMYADGFLEFHRFDHLTTVGSSGVGGGSLHYTNIMEEPAAEFFDAYPDEITGEGMRPYFDRVRAVLRPSPIPEPAEKDCVFTEAVAAAGLPAAEYPDLAVAWGEHPGRQEKVINAADVEQSTAIFQGAVWILFLNADGTVRAHQKISETEGGFTGDLDGFDLFGNAVESLGDLDGDGIEDLAVGAAGYGDGGFNRGAVWVLFLNADGTVKAHQKISDTEGGFTGTLDDVDDFGTDVANLGDLDGDGVVDLTVSAARDDDGGNVHGAVWVLFLNANGTVKGFQKISDIEGGFAGSLDNGDLFGQSVAPLGDLDGDGVVDLAVGAGGDGDFKGAVWVLFLDGAPSTNLPPVIVSTPDAPVLAIAGSPFSFSVEFIPPESDQVFNSVGYSLNGGITLSDLSCSTSFGPVGGVTTSTCSGSIDTPGSYSVDITPTDDGSPPLSTTTTVAVLVAEDVPAAIDLLAGDVTSLSLPTGTETSLLVKLRQAQRKADEGMYHVAIVLLRAFISDVEDASGDTIDLADADRLIAIAEAIIAALEDAATAAPSAAAPAAAADATTPAVPDVLALPGLYPNPARDRATLRFGLPEAGPVRVAVYDVTGREVGVVIEGPLEAGWHEAAFDASRLPSGVYVVRATTGAETVVRRVTVLR